MIGGSNLFLTNKYYIALSDFGVAGQPASQTLNQNRDQGRNSTVTKSRRLNLVLSMFGHI